MEDEKLVTICEFNQPAEAHIAKSKLESAGIECCIQDELGNLLYANAVCSVELQVKSSQLEQAKTILDDREEI